MDLTRKGWNCEEYSRNPGRLKSLATPNAATLLTGVKCSTENLADNFIEQVYLEVIFPSVFQTRALRGFLRCEIRLTKKAHLTITMQFNDSMAYKNYWNQAKGLCEMFYLMKHLKHQDVDLQIPSALYNVLLPLVSSLYHRHFYPSVRTQQKQLILILGNLPHSVLLPVIIPIVVEFVLPIQNLFG